MCKECIGTTQYSQRNILTLGNKVVLFSKRGVFSGTQLSKVEEEELIQSYQTIYQALNNNNNNVHLSCAHQGPERSHDTY